MVKLYAVCILYKKQESALWLKAAYDLQSFRFFQRGSVQELMAFTGRTIVERTQTASRQSVKEGDYVCHVNVRADNLSGVVIANEDYPQRVAHTLIMKVLDEFENKYPPSTWPKATEKSIDFPQVNTYLTNYQNPREADVMTKIQEDLDETKIILHDTIKAVLQRGEKIEDLISKSEALGSQSKTFYEVARKTNSRCCNLG